MKFDCGNRTEDCDNAMTCPCLNFIEKTKESYDKVIKSDIFKKATEESIDSDKKINKIIELLQSGEDDTVVLYDIMKVVGIYDYEYKEPFIKYGKIIDLPDERELWSEPITDARDGLVLRNQYGSIVTTYLQES